MNTITMSDSIFSKFSLEGKVSVVTGASRGLGRAIAIALAEAGSDVAAVARSQSAIEETASEVRGRGRRALSVPCDVHDFKSVAATVERVIDDLVDRVPVP